MNNTWIIFIVPIILSLFLYYARKPGKAGIIGKKIRISDYYAWKDTVNEKQIELNELIKCKPKLE